MTLQIPDEVYQTVASHPYRVVFASISGAHLYGFASADSDWDVRGAHALPLEQLLGIQDAEETHEAMFEDRGIELDVVTYDLRKFCRLLMKKNGNVLEQVVSPFVVATSPAHASLADIAKRCVTRHHMHHYKGLAMNRWRLIDKSEQAEVKPVLYAFRAVLTGLHLLETGEVEPNLAVLNEVQNDPLIRDLIMMKRDGAEHEPLTHAEVEPARKRFNHYLERMLEAFETSSLPDDPPAAQELNDWLVSERIGHS